MTDPVVIQLPYPVSANRYWRHYGGRTVRSEEANEYRDTVRWLCHKERIRPLEGRLDLHLWLHPQRPQDWASRARKNPNWEETVQSMDVDNAMKVLIDSLQKILYDNDKQLWRVTCERREPAPQKCVLLRVQPYQPGELIAPAA